jgi:hypothetical protein
LDLLVVEGVVLPQGFFRYVTLSRVAAYAATGWPIIGATLSPHDGRAARRHHGMAGGG